MVKKHKKILNYIHTFVLHCPLSHGAKTEYFCEGADLGPLIINRRCGTQTIVKPLDLSASRVSPVSPSTDSRQSLGECWFNGNFGPREIKM